MENSKLLEIIKVQNEILSMIIKDYTMISKHTPIENERMNNLRKELERLSKDIEQ